MLPKAYIHARSNIRSTVQTKAGTSSSKLVEFAVISGNVSSKVTGAGTSFFSSRELPVNEFENALVASYQARKLVLQHPLLFPPKEDFSLQGC